MRSGFTTQTVPASRVDFSSGAPVLLETEVLNDHQPEDPTEVLDDSPTAATHDPTPAWAFDSDHVGYEVQVLLDSAHEDPFLDRLAAALRESRLFGEDLLG